VNITIRLVVRRNKTAPVRTGQLLVALHAPQAFNVPYLFLHDYLLGHINSFTARSTLFGRSASPFGLRTRRAGSGGRGRVFRRTVTGAVRRTITRRRGGGSRSTLSQHQTVKVNGTIGLVFTIGVNETAPIGSVEFLGAFYALQTIDVPDLVLHG